jgi:polyisoprenoid-binding protein YceI
MHRRTFIIAASATCLASPAIAAQRRYILGANGARITYTFTLNGAAQSGRIPVQTADIRIDPNDLSNSFVDVSADVRRARTGLVFATQALKSPAVLDAKAHPLARFRSTKITLGPQGRISDGATMTGQLTLRGATKPIRFDANIFRPQGSAKNDFSQLTVRLRGQLNRKDFGATGYPELVDNTVRVDIDADIRAAI